MNYFLNFLQFPSFQFFLLSVDCNTYIHSRSFTLVQWPQEIEYVMLSTQKMWPPPPDRSLSIDLQFSMKKRVVESKTPQKKEEKAIVQIMSIWDIIWTRVSLFNILMNYSLSWHDNWTLHNIKKEARTFKFWWKKTHTQEKKESLIPDLPKKLFYNTSAYWSQWSKLLFNSCIDWYSANFDYKNRDWLQKISK